MSNTQQLEVARTAVVVMDYQSLGVSMVVKEPALIGRVAGVLDAARAVKLPIVYVALQFRTGHPEVHPRNTGLVNGIKKHGLFVAGQSGTEIHPTIAPQEEDVLVVKRRLSAFSGSDLAMVLRSRQIETLILMGIATSGVVLSTVREAFDADYDMFLVEDCCADPDPELHRVLIDRVLSRQASVVRSGELVTQLRALG